MDKTHPLNTLITVRSLNSKKDIFRPKENDGDIISPKVPYLNTIEALLYLTQYTRPDIAFSVPLLARFSFAPIPDSKITSNIFFVTFIEQ